MFTSVSVLLVNKMHCTCHSKGMLKSHNGSDAHREHLVRPAHGRGLLNYMTNVFKHANAESLC